MVTGVGGGDDAGAGEVAVEVVAAVGLEEGVHGEGGVGLQGVGEEAGPAVLDGAAVHAAAARVVYVALQRVPARVRLRHAPLPAPRRRRVRLRGLKNIHIYTFRIVVIAIKSNSNMNINK